MFRFLLKGHLIIIFALCLNAFAGSEIPDVVVRDELGRESLLSKTLGKESLLILGYYNCRHICHDTIFKVQKKISGFTAPLSVSFLSLRDDEGPGDALRVKGRVKGARSENWHFLTAESKETRALARNLDFSFKEDPASGTLTHENTIFLIREGKLAKRLNPLTFTENDLKIAHVPSKFFDYKQFCSEFDPNKSKYGAMIVKALSFASAIFVGLLVLFYFRMSKRKYEEL